MTYCPRCSAELGESATECSVCGLSVDEATAVLPADPQADTPTKLSSPSRPNNTPLTTGSNGRFVSGTVLVGRYRIVGLIGKGGLYGNVIRTGVMLNSTTDTIDKLIAALDAGLALC